MNYGQALKEQREMSGHTQNSLAKATGISQPKISYYESGQHTPPIDHCVTLAQFYGITVDELIGLSDSPHVEQQTPRTLPAELPNKAVTFVNEYGELLDDSNFQNAAKLFSEITPELRALALGYLVGLLQNNGVNTKRILGY